MIDDSGLVRLEVKINRLIKKDLALKTAAQVTTQQMAARIFPNAGSKDKNNRQLGVYTPGYMKQRKKVNRSNKKINLQFTGQMAKDWSLLILKKGNKTIYGSGFKNDKNAEKADWVEGTYGTTIFEPTKKEIQIFNKVYKRKLSETLR